MYRLVQAPEDTPASWYVFYTLTVLLFAFIIGLNLYWYSFILKGAQKLLQGKKPGVDIDFEKEKGR